MWSIIENLLSEMRQKTIEEYYADFARLEGWLRDQERLLTPKKDHRNTIVNLCENLTLELYTYPAWMKIHLLSFCMKCSEERKYAEWLMQEILEADYDVLGEYNKYFLYWQMTSGTFDNANLQSETIDKGKARLYRELFDSFYQVVKVDTFPYLPVEERNRDLVFLFTSQFLTEVHGPTKTVCDRAYFLQHDLKKKAVIINTGMLLTQKGDSPFYNRAEGGYMEKYTKMKHLKFRGETFEYVQCENNMPDLDTIRMLMRRVEEEKPYCIINIGGGDLCADLCGTIVPEITITTVPSELAVTTGTFQVTERDLKASDYELLQILGVKPEHVTKALFTFVFKQQNCYFTRRELGFSEEAMILLVTGWRLGKEVQDDFLKMLEKLVCGKDLIEVVFMGLFEDYKQTIASYPKLAEQCHYLEYQADALAVTECCDLYVNPKRKGGGTSSAEALFMGLPAVTLPYGDVAAAAGERFWVNDYAEMADQIIRYCRDKAYYETMSKLAKERAAALTDSKTHFCETFQKIERDPEFL